MNMICPNCQGPVLAALIKHGYVILRNGRVEQELSHDELPVLAKPLDVVMELEPGPTGFVVTTTGKCGRCGVEWSHASNIPYSLFMETVPAHED